LIDVYAAYAVHTIIFAIVITYAIYWRRYFFDYEFDYYFLRRHYYAADYMPLKIRALSRVPLLHDASHIAAYDTLDMILRLARYARAADY